jgi:hypothetical protein
MGELIEYSSATVATVSGIYDRGADYLHRAHVTANSEQHAWFAVRYIYS